MPRCIPHRRRLDWLVQRITSRLVTEVLDTSDMSDAVRDTYIASPELVDDQLSMLTRVADRLTTFVGSPSIAADAVKAWVSAAAHGARVGHPDAVVHEMMSSTRSALRSVDDDITELQADVAEVVRTLRRAVTHSDDRASDVVSMVVGHLDQYVEGHGG